MPIAIGNKRLPVTLDEKETKRIAGTQTEVRQK